MKNPFLIIASALGATGVALGAMGAHALKEKMKEGLMSPEQLSGWDTASKYQLLHALAIFLIYFLFEKSGNKTVRATGWLFTLGVLFFSGSIYCLSTMGISGINFRFLGPITPIGGVLMIAGWACLLVYAIKERKSVSK